MTNFKLKGGCGGFKYGYDTESKCRWLVINRKTNEVVAEVQNMAEAIKKAQHFDFVQKNPETMEYLC